jgi:hypothetical protein
MLADAAAIQRRLQPKHSTDSRGAWRRHLGEVVASKLFAPSGKESAYLAMAIVLELQAKGFQIVNWLRGQDLNL